jgi:lysyl-tRNA synthetase class 2
MATAAPASDDWRPGTSREMLQARARLRRTLRDGLERRGSIEVDPPTRIHATEFEPHIALQRVVEPDGRPAGALHSSPELTLKRLLCAYPDLTGVHFLGPVFRAGETGRRHHPEFTLLEWYETGVDLEGVIDTTLELIRQARAALALAAAPVVHRDYGRLFRDWTGLDPYRADNPTLARTAHLAGITVHHPGDMERDDWLDLLMSRLIEPRLPADTLTVVRGYPASQAAMARLTHRTFEGRPIEVADRFEVYGGGIELANGYHELTDAAEQARRLGPAPDSADERSRHRFIEALQHGLPACSGVALGVDRLLMWLAGADSLDAVMPFSAARV